jgi:hypothetical protein
MAWTELPGDGRTTDAPTAVAFAGRVWVFVRAEDGSVWANNGDDAGAWAGWEQIGPAGTLYSAPAAVVSGSRLLLFGRGPNDGVFALSRDESEGWS